MSFIYLGVSESLLGRKNMNVMYWKLCLMKAKAMFAVLVLSKQQAKLTEFQLIFDVVGFFFSYSILSLAKVKELTCTGLI